MISSTIDRHAIHPQFPTHLHSGKFWEQLGRAVATFGFLEDTLKKAIFALTATTEYDDAEAQKVLQNWGFVLENAMTDTLSQLAENYGKVVRDHHLANCGDIDALMDEIKRAAGIRNAICHGCWMSPETSGKSPLIFVNRQMEEFDTLIDIAWLRQVQDHVVTLCCDVINSVTQLGWQFPGGAGPGTPIWERSPFGSR